MEGSQRRGGIDLVEVPPWRWGGIGGHFGSSICKRKRKEGASREDIV